MKYDVEKMIQTTICQKCDAKPTKTPLTEYLLPNGLLQVPEILHCPKCGNYVTIQVRVMTKEELELRDKEDAEDIAAAEKALEGEFHEISSEAIEVSAEVLKDTVMDIDAEMITSQDEPAQKEN